MTTASTNTTVSNANTAGFDAWINEIYTNLVTNCGLVQTTDTGQLANPTAVALPGAGATSAGYYIFKFNDTLQATSPVFIKLEFGTGAAVADPQMWITVGTGSNGSGTITGTVMTRVAMFQGNVAPLSTITNYTSRYCYNATQGFLGMAFKSGSISVNANSCMGGFFVFRSVNSAGNTTADSVMLITNSTTATGATSLGNMQVLSYDLSTVYLNSGPVSVSSGWCAIPFSATTSLEGTSGNIFPCFQWSGSSSVAGHGITNACALAILSEIAIGATVTVTILGSVSLTYISVGQPFGGSALGTSSLYSATNFGALMLWQ